MTDQAPELLPCPLCNSKVALSVLEDEPGEIISAWVRCDCGLEIHERRTEAEAIERWNNRPPSERHVAQVREASASVMDFFKSKVDDWGALQWFERLVKAVHEQDAAVLAKNYMAFETCQNVAASSAMRLVRDFEREIRAALTAERPEAGRENLTAEEFAQVLPRPEAAVAWRDDPSADDRWNNGCDFAMTQLCTVLGVDPESVSWDAATETVDGDVRSVIGNIMHAKYGEDWSSSLAIQHEEPGRETLPAMIPPAVERAIDSFADETLKRGYTSSWWYGELWSAIRAALTSPNHSPPHRGI